MAKVRVRNENVEFEMHDGEPLMPYAQKHSAMPFGCGKGQCGLCICNVAKGGDNVNPKTQAEEQTLARLGAYPSQRLACQLRIRKGEVEIEY